MPKDRFQVDDGLFLFLSLSSFTFINITIIIYDYESIHIRCSFAHCDLSKVSDFVVIMHQFVAISVDYRVLFKVDIRYSRMANSLLFWKHLFSALPFSSSSLRASSHFHSLSCI